MKRKRKEKTKKNTRIVASSVKNLIVSVKFYYTGFIFQYNFKYYFK